MEACEKAYQNPIHKRIVDQIVAVDNFVAFKKLMQKRNAELNQQALKLYQKNQQKEQAKKSASDAEQTAKGDDKGEDKLKNAEKMIADQEKMLKSGAKTQDKEMLEAIRIAQEAERAEEEEAMRRAIEESEALRKKEEEEDAKLIKQAIEEIAKEEAALANQKVEEPPKKEEEPPKKVEEPPKKVEEIVKVEEAKESELKEAKVGEVPQDKLIEITGKPAMSQAELKKFQELKRLQKEAKLQKQKEAKQQAEKMNQIQSKADSLPPVNMNRRGQFALIPDFLQQETKKDLANLASLDALAEAQAKQDALNAESGVSMAELFK